MKFKALRDAVVGLQADDALPLDMPEEDWEALSRYLAVRFLKEGDALIREGEDDRELYFLEQGGLHVSIKGTLVASLKPGTVVGEGTFFSGRSRSATVTASQAGVAWALSDAKFEGLAKKHPRVALHVVRAAAAVLAIRMREAILVGHFT